MSRGEEEELDERSTGDDDAVPEERPDLSKPESAGEPPEPAPRPAVVISGDGSAAIDGEPVPVAEGESLDAAILDRLQEYARDLNAGVRATISDPAAGYVAYVEVAPDGSSSLLEQQQEEQEQRAQPGFPPEPAVPHDLDDTGTGTVDNNEDGAECFDVPAPTPEQPRRLTTPPLPVVGLGPKVAPGQRRRQSDEEYKSPGLLHKPLVVGLVALGVAALVIVPLVVLGSGASDKGERQKRAARSSSKRGAPLEEVTAPAASSSASARPSATSTSPSAKPKASESAKAPKNGGTAAGAGGAGGTTVTVTAKPPRATVTAKPAQDTAATAVNRLHRSDPSGRHICYRAYLSGQGWQKPVCDGTLAGTTSGSHPIQALNIAVYGGNGSAANAFVHDAKSANGQGKWEPQWTAVIGDGRNNYVGSTKSGAPYMTGFAINIGSGRVCRTTKVHGYDWGSEGCTQSRPRYIFGGALENTRWLEAVKFWV
ncbi:hypothetical protein ACFRDV_26640 [Streptomyces fagopyri]|uniref:hypothetical protein n=1 Tax=Streptomyces fagopyri TaxID=2662397 RepID=UPI00369F80C1